MTHAAGTPHIVHLDDDQNDAALVSFHLRAKKYACTLTWVRTEAEFVAALEKGGVDLVLSDYRMPGYDGDQALRWVRTKHSHLPFIMLTGELGEDRAIETLKRGATDYVLKGNLTRLLPSIERALREADAEAERRGAEAELKQLRDQLSRELADMKRLHDLNRRLLDGRDMESMLHDVLTASIGLVGAQKGNVQILDAGAQALTIKTHVGFGSPFLDEFRLVTIGKDCVCAQALRRQERIVVKNVFEDSRFPSLGPHFQQEGLSAVLSTPLVGRNEKVFGMLSVHFSSPHTPTAHELGLLDLYVQQAERVIELKEASF